MIRHYLHTEIDKTKWDKRVASSPQGLVYAFSWYLDIVSPGWEALVEDDYNAVFPLTARRKAGINYLFQPYFTQQLGLFTDDKIIPESRMRDFIGQIPAKYKLVEIQLNPDNVFSPFNGYSISQRLTHYLDLSQSYEITRKNYSENLNRNIKKSDKSMLEITSTDNTDGIVDLFRKNRGASIENLKNRDYETLEKIIEAAREKKLIECWKANIETEEIIAGAIFLKSVHSTIFIFSAVNADGKEVGAMSAIIDSFIKAHSGEPSFLDFEGSMDANLARYYKSFGSKEIVYLQIRKNNLPFIIRWLK